MCAYVCRGVSVDDCFTTLSTTLFFISSFPHWTIWVAHLFFSPLNSRGISVSLAPIHTQPHAHSTRCSIQLLFYILSAHTQTVLVRGHSWLDHRRWFARTLTMHVWVCTCAAAVVVVVAAETSSSKYATWMAMIMIMIFFSAVRTTLRGSPCLQRDVILCEVCKEGIKAPTIRHFKVIAHDATDGLTSLLYTLDISFNHSFYPTFTASKWTVLEWKKSWIFFLVFSIKFFNLCSENFTSKRHIFFVLVLNVPRSFPIILKGKKTLTILFYCAKV